MRPDSIGLFWQDREVIKIPKPPPPKRVPPERTWERPDYLPRLDEAKAFAVDLFDPDSLYRAFLYRETLFMDIECYPNYFLVAFTSYESGKVVYFEMRPGEDMDLEQLRWIVDNFLVVTFNGKTYDFPMLALALAGATCEQLKQVSDAIIKYDERPYNILKAWKVKELRTDHIDLIEVCPLQASLKIYGGRLHTPRMQDLPFPIDTELTEDQIAIVRWYCVNDLTATAFIYVALESQLELRTKMSISYGVDLRSKSDAQIAEAVINSELTRINGLRPTKPTIEPGTVYRYNVPAFLQYQTPLMQQVLSTIRGAEFVVAPNGAVEKPKVIEELEISIGGTTYTMGIGGLHSTEKSVAHKADARTLLFDRDVSSYYPAIILNQNLYPDHLGKNFLTVYRSIVTRRLAAKKAGNKIEAEVLKIVINGSFGKFGSPWSTLYAPQLLIQTTITGQLSLLLLIERLELAGIAVVSANTDGMLVRCPTSLEPTYRAIVDQWEKDINFQTEETPYSAYYSKDVNNYIAVKLSGKTKQKGAYNNPWNDPDPGQAIFRFHKNPVNTICIEAVTEYLTNGVPLAKTIRGSRDVKKFLTVRTVKGGAVKSGEYLGKAIRWYYAAGEKGEIINALNGHQVPKSVGARPLMDLPLALPPDLDYSWYVNEAQSILVDIGVWPAPPPRRKATVPRPTA